MISTTEPKHITVLASNDALLPPQDMRVGSRIVRKVPFVIPASGSQNVPDREEDGILATVLFQRVYVSHSDRFVVFDPR